MEFFLDHPDNAPVAVKHLHTSANRFVHVVSVDDIDEIDQQLINWMQHSYQLVLSKKQKK